MPGQISHIAAPMAPTVVEKCACDSMLFVFTVYEINRLITRAPGRIDPYSQRRRRGAPPLTQCATDSDEQAALAAKWAEPPRDALDTMILKTGLKLPQVLQPRRALLQNTRLRDRAKYSAVGSRKACALRL